MISIHPTTWFFAEQLIAGVYNALRTSPLWENSLLVVTYDEHGGCFDHVPPPLAVPPGDHHPNEVFSFNRYGVRVPAVIVSPYKQLLFCARPLPDCHIEGPHIHTITRP
jgi:phospholipase C